MIILVVNVYNYWPPLWALSIYALRTIIDMVVWRQGFNSKLFGDKIKALGTDLYWIGVMIWGTVLIWTDSSLQIFKYFDTRPHLRMLLIVVLVIGAMIITALKRVEEGISAKNATGVMKRGQNLWVCILIALMILIGVSNFSAVFFMMGLSQA